VAAELALLVAVLYVPLVIGSLYLGWLAIARERIHESNHYALYTEGDQTEALEEKGEVHQQFFREFTGHVAVTEGDAEDYEIPGPDELRKLFEAYTEPIHYRNVSAHGSFSLVNGRVVYNESIRVDEGYRIRPEGELVNSWRLLEDNIPENCTRHLQDYLRRRMATSLYEHSWIHDELSIVKGDEKHAAWNRKVPGDNPARDQWRPEAAIRWEKTREARDSMPPGAEPRSWVGCPATFPDPGLDYDFDYWHPSEGPQPQDDQSDGTTPSPAPAPGSSPQPSPPASGGGQP